MTDTLSAGRRSSSLTRAVLELLKWFTASARQANTALSPSVSVTGWKYNKGKHHRHLQNKMQLLGVFLVINCWKLSKSYVLRLSANFGIWLCGQEGTTGLMKLHSIQPVANTTDYKNQPKWWTLARTQLQSARELERPKRCRTKPLTRGLCDMLSMATALQWLTWGPGIWFGCNWYTQREYQIHIRNVVGLCACLAYVFMFL